MKKQKTFQEAIDKLAKALNTYTMTVSDAMGVKKVLSKVTDDKIKNHPFAKYFKPRRKW